MLTLRIPRTIDGASHATKRIVDFSAFLPVLHSTTTNSYRRVKRQEQNVSQSSTLELQFEDIQPDEPTNSIISEQRHEQNELENSNQPNLRPNRAKATQPPATQKSNERRRTRDSSNVTQERSNVFQPSNHSNPTSKRLEASTQQSRSVTEIQASRFVTCILMLCDSSLFLESHKMTCKIHI
jgi:hypothetical protein